MKKRYIISDFSPDEKTLMLHETLFHNANGYLGVRASLEENVPQGYNTMRGTYINGFYDVIPMKQSESLCNLIEEKDTMLNVADFQSIRLRFDGEDFSMFSGAASVERVLDMDAGVSERSVLWKNGSDRELSVRFTRMASFTRRNLFTIECEIVSKSFSGKLEVVSVHTGLVRNYSNPNDPRLGANNDILLKPSGHVCDDDTSYLVCETQKSALRVCSAVKHDFPATGRMEAEYDGVLHSCTVHYSVDIRAGETLRFVKYCVLTDSLRSENCLSAAHECMEANFGRLEELYREQREYLAKFWDSAETVIDSEDDSSLAMCFNLYQLLQSCGSDGLCSVASKGLSGEGYEGHYFWDTEIYVLPFLTYTSPALARRLLRYRYRTLSLARENAKLLGHGKGALYPWRTISGRECSGFFPAGTAQYHNNGHIACAVVRYYLATGDKEYLTEEGAEILIETARLWADLGNYYNGKFCIHDVTGPDEYTCIVNNNYYTNACAKYNLTWAVKVSEILAGEAWDKVVAATGVTQSELDEFAAAAEKMYLPYDSKLRINPQDDSFLQKKVWDFANTPKENYPLLLHYHPLCLYRYQVCKQADTILAYLLYDSGETRETMLRSFEYYEKITTHDSSLSNCIFSIVAARLGLKDKAWEYFGESIMSDLVNSHGNTGDGIHTANMGGSYMMIVNGFAGMTLTENGIELAPFVPEAWRGYRFRICYHASVLEVSADKGGCIVRLVSGEPVTLKLYGRPVTLSADRREFRAADRPIQAVVFDLDGVICSTDEYHYLAWKALADRLKIYFDREINNRLRGVSRMASLDIVLERSESIYSDEEKQSFAAEKNECYRRLLDRMTTADLSEDVKKTLEELRRRGYLLAIGSSSKNTKHILSRIGLDGFFDAVSDGTNITRSKPDPEVFLCAAEYLGVAPERCLVVEDAVAGIQAAKSAGMAAAGIGGAAECALSDYRITKLSDLLEFLT